MSAYTSPFSDESLGIERVQRDQADHRYLAAVDELVRIEGVSNIYLVAKFIAATFDVSLGKVLRDAVDQSERYGRVFAQA